MDSEIIARQRRQIDSLTALVKEKHIEQKVIVTDVNPQIRSYSTKKLVTFLKNELDNNSWAEALKKDIEEKVIIDEKEHFLTVARLVDDVVIEKVYFGFWKSAEYDESLKAYVVRRAHDELNNKIVALVFSSLDFSQLKYVGIMKTPDINGYQPLWLYQLNPDN